MIRDFLESTDSRPTETESAENKTYSPFEWGVGFGFGFAFSQLVLGMAVGIIYMLFIA